MKQHHVTQLAWPFRMAFLISALAIALLIGCAPQATPAVDDVATSSPEPAPTSPCGLPTITPPTPPAYTPGYAELDPSTNLHLTGREEPLDLASYRLVVTGKVDNPLSLTYEDLRCLPRQTVRCILVCPGVFEDEATWAGATLSAVLDQAGVQENAVYLRLVSAEGYSAFVSLSAARAGDNLIAYEWEGEPLPILHGFPVRAVFPDLEGSRWVKWLVRIEVE
jgi:DMSO/TMAO reductase YedYZ molybdopterin-dependent catalytic subunit